jgi:uncharacterized protein (DUF952 family)
MTPIYHITSRAAWGAAKKIGAYTAPSLAGEGFIHCSQAGQIERVANAFYAGQKELFVLVIDPAKITSPLKWEDPSHPMPNAPIDIPSAEKFPHIHGPLNLEAVIRTIVWAPDANGSFIFPLA